MAKPFDLAIFNATVVDGTGAPARVTDVAIRGDRIERVGTFQGEARRSMDAFGKVLSPGFVDFHGHSDYSLLMDPLARSKVFQGITTEVGGNCGYHAAPVFGQVALDRKNEFQRTCGFDVTWQSSAEYRASLVQARPTINYAQQIGYNTLRSSVTADHAKPLSAAERDHLRKLVRDEFQQGAVGLSYGLAYAPACFSKTEELVDVAQEAAAAGGFISFHIRNEDNTLIESLEEALHIGREAQARVHIGHLKTFRRPNWHKIDAALELLDGARRKGMDLTVDRYPHLAMNTQLKFALPMWALEGGINATKTRLKDKDVRARIARELGSGADSEAREVLISLVGQPQHKHLEGKFLDELAGDKDPWEVMCELLSEEGDSAFATFLGMNPDNLDRILALDYTIVASDASIQAIHRQLGGGRPHPRCFDTFPYFLAEWVLARGMLDLPTAIRKITSFPAQRAGLVDRGVVAEGAFADLVLFNPQGLRAVVSYQQPIAYPEGVEWVMVNGQAVVGGGAHLGAQPGRILNNSHIRL